MKKALKITGQIITVLIVIFTVFMMVFTVISVNTVNKEDASIFGYKPYIVLSESMQDTFAAGDIAVSKSVDVETLKAGDIITFRSIDPANYDEVVTHKIRQITTYEGQTAFVTYGTTTGTDDTYPVPADHVIGKYVFRLPKMGYFFQFLKTPAGYFTLILIPFLLLIVIQAVKFFRLVRQYKTEQQAELETQKAQIEAERLKTQQMMEELQRLRDQLSSGAEQSAQKESSQPEDAVPPEKTGGDQ